MNFLKDLIVSLAAIFTAAVAYFGIHKWRQEEAGKADFELARRVGTAIFRLRDAITAARNPMIWANEFPEDYEPSNLAKQGAAYAHVFSRRYEPVKKCATELQALSNETEALWGDEITTDINNLLKYPVQLLTSIQMYVRNKYEFGTMFKRNEDFANHIESIVQDIPHLGDADQVEKNRFTSQFEGAISEAASKLREKLPAH